MLRAIKSVISLQRSELAQRRNDPPRRHDRGLGPLAPSLFLISNA